jgi:hypothetical protein
MEKLVELAETCEDKFGKYLVLERQGALALRRKISKQSGRISYELGRVAVEPEQVHPLSGVTRAEYEYFVSEASFDNERAARQEFRLAVLKAEREAATQEAPAVPQEQFL